MMTPNPSTATPALPLCLICGQALKVSLTTSQKGRYAVALACPVDGRHFRGFVNHRPFVVQVMADTAALQKGSKTPNAPDGEQ